MEIRKVVIPVAGIGTRLFPTTRALPKEMLPVGRHPTIQHVVDELATAGLSNLLFITSPSKHIIERQFVDPDSPAPANAGENGKASGLTYTFAEQQTPPGWFLVDGDHSFYVVGRMSGFDDGVPVRHHKMVIPNERFGHCDRDAGSTRFR